MINELIVILCIITAFFLYKFLTNIGISGGYRRAEITNLFDMPKSIEAIDDITGEVTIYDTKKDKYSAPDTDTQIQTISRHGSVSDYSRLIQLVGKFYRGPAYNIPRLLNRKDSDLYTELRNKFPRENIDSTKRDHYQAEGIYRCINGVVDKKHDVYLDIGCNRGGITIDLAKMLKVKRTLGVDVIDASHPDIEYTKLSGGKLPFPDGSIDLITANMTLHHIKNIEEISAEIYRVLRPGGHVFIKEHDCWNVHDAMLIDIEHILYDRVGGDMGDYKIYHYTNYYGWDKILQPLKYVRADYSYTNLRNEMSATRAFWCIYTKS